ncbi:hypothetical protein LTR95_000272 [Oleoguttula sp. CCFEE 5521]
MSDPSRELQRTYELLRRSDALFDAPTPRNTSQAIQQGASPAISRTAVRDPYVNGSASPSLRRRELQHERANPQSSPSPAVSHSGDMDGARATPRTIPAFTPRLDHAFPTRPSLSAQERRERRDMERYFLGPHANRSSGEQVNGAIHDESEDLLSGIRSEIYNGPGDVRQAFDSRQARQFAGTPYREDLERNARLAPLARPPLIPPPGTNYYHTRQTPGFPGAFPRNDFPPQRPQPRRRPDQG